MAAAVVGLPLLPLLPVLLLKNSYSVTLLRTLHFSGSLVQFCFSILVVRRMGSDIFGYVEFLFGAAEGHGTNFAENRAAGPRAIMDASDAPSNSCIAVGVAAV